MSLNFIQICLCKRGGWEHLSCPMQTKGRYKITALSNKPSNQICSCSFQSKHWAGSKEHLHEVKTTGELKNSMEISCSWQLPIQISQNTNSQRPPKLVIEETVLEDATFPELVGQEIVIKGDTVTHIGGGPYDGFLQESWKNEIIIKANKQAKSYFPYF